VWNALKAKWDLAGDIQGDEAKHLAKSLARASLAICHSPLYEQEHKDSLAQDWAHIPIPRVRDTLVRLAAAGDQVAVLLNPLSDAGPAIRQILGDAANRFAVVSREGGGPVRSADLVISYSFFGSASGGWRSRPFDTSEGFEAALGASTGDLYLNDAIFFRNVPEAVWSYELGGYPVIKKWLAYRDKGRRPDVPLSLEESQHLRGMIQRVAALLLLHDRLNTLYEAACKDCFRTDELGLV
jgi:hypothetical protein